MNTKKLIVLPLCCLLCLIAVEIYVRHVSKEQEQPTALLKVRWAMLGDSIPVDDVALFVLTKEDSMYNDCECSQNVPVVDGLQGLETVEAQEIYAEHPAVVMAYSPMRANAWVDSIPWNITWTGGLKVAGPCLVTSHLPELELSFHHLMGKILLRVDGMAPAVAFLRGDIPLEGHYDLLQLDWHVEKRVDHIVVEDDGLSLLPGTYRNAHVVLDGKELPLDFSIEAGKTTLCNFISKENRIDKTLISL